MDRDLFSRDQPVTAPAHHGAREPRWPDFDPHAATRQILHASTAEQRSALLLSAVPKAWRDIMLHFVVVALAGRVFEAIPAERERLRTTIPEEWLPEVRAHLQRYAARASARAAIEAARRG